MSEENKSCVSKEEIEITDKIIAEWSEHDDVDEALINLQAQLAKHRWIPVSEEVIEEDKAIFFIIKETPSNTCFAESGEFMGGLFWATDGNSYKIDEVSHYMYQPPLPNKEESDG